MPKTVLVIDDEEVVVDIAKRKLMERGFHVLTAGNGEEGLARLKEMIPDLIVLDVQMPKMNGYTFIVEKSKNPSYAGIPVIVVTAYNQSEPLFERHGVHSYLLKPLKLQELLDRVSQVLGGP
jgi:CheY-like chemotaxis protein